MNIVIIGPPGSGKSTQAELLASKLEIPHLQTGKIFRSLARQETKQGRRIKKILAAGLLVPDRETIKIVDRLVKKAEYREGFVLDGTPRNLWQAENLKVTPDKIFYLRVSEEENIRRLVKRKRRDDQPEIIKKRLVVYHRETEPVLEYYRQKGILEEIDGERPVEKIFGEIVNRLSRKK